jgi:hypothetical protein
VGAVSVDDVFLSSLLFVRELAGEGCCFTITLPLECNG